ncbi:MAG TPA: ABC transporter ATP-binding protein [Candidatus Paceibacterota bacterium]|nr:ABC transporter ATP-binding protein [Candidatus Paceibacterota bacterium]
MIAESTERRKAFFDEASQFLRGSFRAHRTIFEISPWTAMGMILSSVVSSLAGFLVVWASALLIDQLFAVAGGTPVSPMLPFIIALAIFSAVLPDMIGTFRELMDRTFWLRLGAALEIRLARARFAIDVATHESPKYQDTHTKASERGIFPVMNLVDMQYAVIADVFSLMIASTILWQINPLYVLGLVVGVAPRLFVGFRYGRDVWGIHDMRAEDRRKFYFLRGFPNTTDWLMESHLLGLGRSLVERMRGLAEDFLALQLSIERKKALWNVAAMIFLALVYASVYGDILGRVFGGALTVGGFIFATGAFARFGDPLQRIFLGIGRQYEFWLFAREVFRVMDNAPALPKPAAPIAIDLHTPITIAFEHVTFRYPDAARDTICDISFTIQSGTSFALVGLNGAGKTTLVKLLCRFYDPTHGRILINGVDLREIDLGTWYRALAVLFQHFPTYESFTAGEGIALGDSSVAMDRDRVRRAAEISGASEFIRDWPLGYDQMVGRQFEGGVNPSRGQEQRLALARMFYRGARCVLLDEPTAAVDAESEAKIFSAIEAMQGTTRMMISHRFSTVRHADQICVIRDGSIIELGTHAELMEQDGEYARLFRLQAKGYEDPAPPAPVRKRGRKAA